MLSLVIPAILTGIGYLLRPQGDNGHATSSYECGFIPVEGQSLKPMLTPFFIVGLIFLLFDLELLWVLPTTPLREEAWSGGKISTLIFFSFVGLSLLFETCAELITFK